MTETNASREVGRTVLAAGKIAVLQRIDWVDPAGRARVWEAMDRVSGLGAVAIVARLMPSERLVLVRQYRPPARGTVIEFPAGVLDPGETPEVAAIRELREETGYVGTLRRVLPKTFTSPGMSGETISLVFADIDEADPANRSPVPCPDDGEFIETILVPLSDPWAFVEGMVARGERFDGRVMAFFSGLAGDGAAP